MFRLIGQYLRQDLAALRAEGPVVRASKRLSRVDGTVAFAVFLVAAWLYSRFGLRLAQGSFLHYYDLAFDFDAVAWLDALVHPDVWPDGVNPMKHPFSRLLQLVAWPFLAGGLEPKQAAAVVMAAVGAGSVALCYLFLRIAEIAWAEAIALTALFCVTSTQIFTAIIPESYGFSGFALVLVWLLALVRLDRPRSFIRLRYFAAVLAFGITVTNVVQPFIAELLVWWRPRGLRKAIDRCIVFGIILAGLIVVSLIMIWPREIVSALQDPVLALKTLYWQQGRPGPKTGLGQVILTFTGFSFVSPDYVWITLPSEGIVMRDFRAFTFSLSGLGGIFLWFLFAPLGAFAGLAHPRYRWIAIGLAAALAFNLLLHTRVQDRASLYLYAAHSHFLIFALAAGAAPWMRGSRIWRHIYIVTVVLMTLMIGTNNLGLAGDFVTSFDDVTCTAPCGPDDAHIGLWLGR